MSIAPVSSVWEQLTVGMKENLHYYFWLLIINNEVKIWQEAFKYGMSSINRNQTSRTLKLFSFLMGYI